MSVCQRVLNWPTLRPGYGLSEDALDKPAVRDDGGVAMVSADFGTRYGDVS